MAHTIKPGQRLLDTGKRVARSGRSARFDAHRDAIHLVDDIKAVFVGSVISKEDGAAACKSRLFHDLLIKSQLLYRLSYALPRARKAALEIARNIGRVPRPVNRKKRIREPSFSSVVALPKRPLRSREVQAPKGHWLSIL